MWRTVFLFSLLLAMAVSVPLHEEDYDGNEEKQCLENADCPQGNFCYTETHRCANCIDCASRFRQNGDWKCHQEASDCGECLIGYVEPSLERNTKKESCMPQKPGHITTSKTSSASSPDSEDMTDSLSTYGVKVILPLALVSLTLVVTLLYHLRKPRRSPTVQQTTELQELVSPEQNVPPPPYYPLAPFKCQPIHDPTPSAPYDATVLVNSPRDCATNIEVQTHPPVHSAVESERLVCAAFDGSNPPNWVNARNYTGYQSPPITPPVSPPQSPPPTGGSQDSSIDIQDDTTQPSDWTPNTSQENVEESLNQQAAPDVTVHVAPVHVGSTAVGTIPEMTRRTNGQELNWRANSNEDQASGQEANDNEGPKQKKMRSESPPPSTRHFPPGVFMSQQNTIGSHTIVHNTHNASIQINLSLSRDDHSSDSSSSPNLLLDSEDFMT